MTPEEQKRMNWLCERIQEEQEPKEFDKLVAELNDHIASPREGIPAERNSEPN